MSSRSLSREENRQFQAELRLRGKKKFIALFGYEPPSSWGTLWAAEFDRAASEEKAFRPAVEALLRGKVSGDRARKLRRLLEERGIDLDAAPWAKKPFWLLPDVVKDILLRHGGAGRAGHSDPGGYKKTPRKRLQSEERPFFDRSHWHQFVVAEFARAFAPPRARSLRINIKGVQFPLNWKHTQSYLLRPRDVALLSYVVRADRCAIDVEGPNQRIKQDARAIERIIMKHWGYTKPEMVGCFAPEGTLLLAPRPPA